MFALGRYNSSKNGPDDVRALILDDDPIYRAVAENVLRSLDIADIDTRSEGSHALKAIAAADPAYDLIVLDLNMPGIDGLAFLRALGEIHFSGGVIVVSGERQAILTSAKHIAIQHGLKVYGALGKPLQVAEMREALARLRSGASFGPRPAPSELAADGECLQPILHYQPQVDIHDCTVVGAEALLRCGTREGLVLGPDAILQRATGLAQRLELTQGLFDMLCADIRTLCDRTGWNSTISFNVDARVMEAAELLATVVETVRRHGVKPSQITIELTESQLPRDPTRLLEVIARLGMAGFELSLDDFGTGASNFELLRKGAFSEVKIDHSIVQAAMHGDAVARKFLDTTAEIGRTLSLKVIAEGVEQESDLARLDEVGISIAQGYYFAKPTSLDIFAHRLRSDGRAMLLAS